MRWLKRKKPPVLQMGDEVLIKAMGSDYRLILSDVTVSFNSPTTATLVGKETYMNRIVIHRDQ